MLRFLVRHGLNQLQYKQNGIWFDVFKHCNHEYERKNKIFSSEYHCIHCGKSKMNIDLINKQIEENPTLEQLMKAFDILSETAANLDCSLKAVNADNITALVVAARSHFLEMPGSHWALQKALEPFKPGEDNGQK